MVLTPQTNTWVLLRGLSRERGHWGDFPVQLQAALPTCRVLMLVLPGNGSLYRQTSPVRIADMVAHCRAALTQQQLAPPFNLLAMSLGAMVAVAWANSHPQEVAAQVLINTSLRPFSPFYQRLRPSSYATLLRLALWERQPEVWERSIFGLTSRLASEKDTLPLWNALRAQHPVRRINVLRQLLAAARFSASLSAAPAPTLLLASAQDALVSVVCSQHLARQWQCDLQIHPSAGHDLPLDDGPWVSAQISRWCSGA